MAKVHLILTSFKQDFKTERDFFARQVIPEFRDWCEKQTLELKFSNIIWGNSDHSKQELCQAFERLNLAEQEEIIHVINISSTELGLVPLHVEQSEACRCALAEFQAKLSLDLVDLKLMRYCYSSFLFQSIFLIRSNSFFDKILPEEKSFFFDPSLTTSSHLLGEEAVDNLPAWQVWTYEYLSAGWNWDENAMDVHIPVDLRGKLLRWLKESVEQSSGSRSEAQVNPLGCDVKRLIHYMHRRSLQMVGREEELEKVRLYLNCKSATAPLVVLGGEGYGKSSLLARVADYLTTDPQWQSNNSTSGQPLVFYHSSSATGSASSLLLMLQRLCLILHLSPDSLSLPQCLSKAVTFVYHALSELRSTPIIVIVDGLDQFQEKSSPLLCSWIPDKLPDNVKVVLSTTMDTLSHKGLISRFEKQLKSLHLLPLCRNHNKTLLENLLVKHGVEFGEMEKRIILANKSSEHPLWLLMAVEDIKMYPMSKERSTRVLMLPEGLQGLWEERIRRLDNSPNGQLVKASLSLLFVSTSGLPRQVLAAILSHNLANLKPPFPYQEKAETEAQEKCTPFISNSTPEGNSCLGLSHDLLSLVVSDLCALMCHSPQDTEVFCLHHTPLQKAVWNVLFCGNEEEEIKPNDGSSTEKFWRKHLVSYYAQNHADHQSAKELLTQLVKIRDLKTLTETLSTWEVTKLLYDEDLSCDLLKFWRESGGAVRMISNYRFLLRKLEAAPDRDNDLIAQQYEVLSRIFQNHPARGNIARCQETLSYIEKVVKIGLLLQNASTWRLNHLLGQY